VSVGVDVFVKVEVKVAVGVKVMVGVGISVGSKVAVDMFPGSTVGVKGDPVAVRTTCVAVIVGVGTGSGKVRSNAVPTMIRFTALTASRTEPMT
jgi:hypothetical protein